MSGDLAITSNTLIQMAVPTIHGPPKDVFEKSYQVAEDFKDRLIIEFKELKERFNKLDAFLDEKDYDKVVEICGPAQTALMFSQYHAMRHYHDILKTRIELLEVFPDKK